MGATAQEEQGLEGLALYDKIIAVTVNFLGLVSEKFVTRLIRTTLHKTPDQLVRQDIVKLEEGIRVAISLLTEDEKTVEEFSRQFLLIAKQDL